MKVAAFPPVRGDELQRLRAAAHLINTGRGVIADPADLTLALREGLIAGVGLDVFEIEPLPADHPLWEMPNVAITPHAAGNAPHAHERRLQVLPENARRFVAGEPLTNVVDKQQWF